MSGVAKGNLGSAGCGGVARNHFGLLVSAVALPLGPQTNHFAKANAAYIGLRMASKEEFKRVWLESDSLNTVKYIMGCIVPRWTILKLIKDCLEMIDDLEDFKILQVFQEGNEPADHLAILAVGNMAVKWWNGEETFTKTLCDLARNDVKICGLSNEIYD
ncbi:uncharacterized protein LOC131039766 [Cryptomeria japonica]|uniref:uncharacterized protein LOC131039766 n=1 Tax=Cryptomeria japonica TaxID=3369 RepID=UPI0025AC8409|nr:uncharacterized protein LOC131039766 [Cryptomeria japonica]